MKHFILIFMVLIVTSAQLAAQNDYQSLHTVAVRAGYGHLSGKLQRLSSNDDNYENRFDYGYVWEGEYTFRLNRVSGFGVVFSQYIAESSHQYGKDHVTISYISPLANLFVIQTDHFSVQINSGIGIYYYNDYGNTFGHSRNAYNQDIATRFGLTLDQKIAKNLYIELSSSYITTTGDRMKVKYHDQTTEIDINGHFDHFNLTLGIAYRFHN